MTTDRIGGPALPDPVLPSARAVALQLLIHGPSSRKNLSRRLGLSAGSLTRLTKPLIDSGVLVETEAVRQKGRGRSHLPLEIAPDRFRFVGVKLTSDVMYAVCTDTRATILGSKEQPIRDQDPEAVTDQIAQVVAEFDAEFGVAAVGVTLGAFVSGGEIAESSPYMHWGRVPLRALIAARIRQPVSIDNDVAGLTRAQHWFGASRGYTDFAMLTVGAGVGYALVIHDEIVQRQREDLGSLDHFPIDPSGPICSLGHRGCASAFLTSEAMSNAVSAARGRATSYEDCLALALAGDAVARRVVDDGAHALGRLVSMVAAFTGVERIVLSGEGIELASVGADALAASLAAARGEGAPLLHPVVKPMAFTEWSRGAAVLAIQDHFLRTRSRSELPS